MWNIQKLCSERYDIRKHFNFTNLLETNEYPSLAGVARNYPVLQC